MCPSEISNLTHARICPHVFKQSSNQHNLKYMYVALTEQERSFCAIVPGGWMDGKTRTKN